MGFVKIILWLSTDYTCLNFPVHYNSQLRRTIDDINDSFHGQTGRRISEDQHYKIQAQLSKNYIPAIQKHMTTYAGYIKSEENYLMGQDVKYQMICDCKNKFAYRGKTECPKCKAKIENLDHPTYLIFTYYYNVRKKKSGKEYKGLPEVNVNEQMTAFASENLAFSPELIEWSKKYITELKDKEINDDVFVEQNRQTEMEEYEKKKIRLREMLRDEQITGAEYRSDLKALETRYGVTANGKHAKVDWYKKMIEIADMTACVEKTFAEGTYEAKRNMLSRMGTNLTWNDENLIISNRKSINKLVEGVKRAKAIMSEFKPKKCLAISGLNEKTSEFSPVFSTMLRMLEEVRTC